MNRPHLLFISLDATRYDYLWSAENAELLPFLNEFRQQSTHFTTAYSNSPWTPPSHASMFTGLKPHEHGVQEGQLWLSEELETVAGYLNGLGYESIGISSNPILGPITNLNKDFKRFYELWKNPEHHSSAAGHLRFDDIILDSRRVSKEMGQICSNEAGQWKGAPVFLFAQFIGPHTPYQPSEEAAQRCLGVVDDSDWQVVDSINRDWRSFYASGRTLTARQLELLKNLYRAELYDLDQGLRGFFQHPWIRELAENAHIIVTADHGEMLGEQNHIHHLFNLYEPLIHVPLLWRVPGQDKGAVSDQTLQHNMLFGMLRELLNGKSMEGVLNDIPEQDISAVLQEPVEILEGLEKISPELCTEFKQDLVALREAELKFIWHSNGEHEAYDLALDPDETHNIFLDQPQSFGSSIKKATGYLGQRRNKDMLERMRNLGYY